MSRRLWEVRSARAADLEAVRVILNAWLVGEVDSRLRSINSTLEGHASRWYLVAVDEDDQVVGLAGLQSDGIDPELVDADKASIELVSMYVHPDHKGEGVGRALLTSLERAARDLGFETMVVVSGSRNRETGYSFWRRQYGDPTLWDDDYFGPGQERVVWKTTLQRSSMR